MKLHLRLGIEVVGMQAKVGDRLLVEGHNESVHRREGEVVEVRGPDGSPPYMVQWEDGHQGLVFPGPDAHIASS